MSETIEIFIGMSTGVGILAFFFVGIPLFIEKVICKIKTKKSVIKYKGLKVKITREYSVEGRTLKHKIYSDLELKEIIGHSYFTKEARYELTTDNNKQSVIKQLTKDKKEFIKELIGLMKEKKEEEEKRKEIKNNMKGLI